MLEKFRKTSEKNNNSKMRASYQQNIRKILENIIL